MTTQTTWKEMPQCGLAKPWTRNATSERRQSRAHNNGRIGFSRILRSVSKGLVMMIALALPLILSIIRVPDDAVSTLDTSVDQPREQGSRVADDQDAATLDRLSDSFEEADAVESTENAFDLPPFDYRSWVNSEETENAIWASGDVPAPIWIEWVSAPGSSLENDYKLSNTDSPAQGFDNGVDKKDKTVPAKKAASRLARLTVYWPEEGDHYTRRRMSSTGAYLRDGHCAVDPKVIPYGSVVKIPGIGEYVAVDTGPAVVSRRAARNAGQTSHERNALVVDIFCSSRSKAQEFKENAPEFAVITWSR